MDDSFPYFDKRTEINDCPICTMDYFAVERSENVCEEHLDTWVVSVCKVCDRACFTDLPGYCPHHKFIFRTGG